jgi:hypothetical protein
MKSKAPQYAAPSLNLRTPAPPRDKARDALNKLVTFCLSHDPRKLAAPVTRVADTHDAIALLRRWFDAYESALPPRVQ